MCVCVCVCVRARSIAGRVKIYYRPIYYNFNASTSRHAEGKSLFLKTRYMEVILHGGDHLIFIEDRQLIYSVGH